MGFICKDLKIRNEVYDELINHFKDKVLNSDKDINKNEWLMYAYDKEIEKADRGDAYFVDKLMACGFGGLSAGFVAGGVALDNPALLLGALATVGISAYNYIRFKKMSLGRALGTRMLYAEALQKIIEENNWKYSFRAGELNDYQAIEDYVKVLKDYEDERIK